MKKYCLILILTFLFSIEFNKTHLIREINADDTLTLTPWNFYEGACSFRHDGDQFAQRFFSGATVGSEILTGFGSPNDSTMETTVTSQGTSDSFTVNILTTGWDGEYFGSRGSAISGTYNEKHYSSCSGDNEYMLKAYMSGIKAKTGHDYNLSFSVEWENDENAPEKNFTVDVYNDYDESICKKTLTCHTKGSVTFNEDFTLWGGDKIEVSLAMGCYLYSFNEGITTESVAAKGTFKLKNLKITDMGCNPDYDEPVIVNPIDVPKTKSGEKILETTKKSNIIDKGKNNTKTIKKKVKVKRSIKKLSIRVFKKQKSTVRVKWKKIKYATGYQIYLSRSKKFKSHTLTRKFKKNKTSFVISKALLGRKKYYVKGRAFGNVNGKKKYGAWSSVKVIYFD